MQKCKKISLGDTAMQLKVSGHFMCKEMPVIPVNKVVNPKRRIGKNGGLKRR
jgi:hypothetical protein